MRILRRLRRLMRRILLGSDPPAAPPPAPQRLYCYLGPDAALTQLLDGHFIYVDPQDHNIAAELMARGFWESWIDGMVRRLVRPGDRIVEVGANHGYYTLVMARIIGPQGRIDSFEAVPHLAELVGRSVAINGYLDRVRVHPLAAGDRAGSVRFNIERRHGGNGRLLAEGERAAGTEVAMVRLDDIITEGRVDVLRMDAEGAELLVLHGARELLARSPEIVIIAEWAVAFLRRHGDLRAEVAGLRAQGFRFWEITVDGRLVEADDGDLCDDIHLTRPNYDVVIARRHPLERAPTAVV